MTLKKEEMTKNLKELKDNINSLLTTDSSKEQIDDISKISQKLDALNDQIEQVYGENAELKENLIHYIKIGGDNKPSNDIAEGGESKSMESCLDEIIAKRK